MHHPISAMKPLHCSQSEANLLKVTALSLWWCILHLVENISKLVCYATTNAFKFDKHSFLKMSHMLQEYSQD